MRAVALIALGTVLACDAGGAPEAAAEPSLLVPAAASLRDLLMEAEPLLEEAVGGGLHFSFAGSSAVLEQARRAAADAVLVARAEMLETAAEDGVVDRSSIRPFASNRLVVVANRRRPREWRLGLLEEPGALADVPFRYLAVADPEAVPAGLYARDFLQSVTPSSAFDEAAAGTLWDRLERRVAPTSDVRAALALAAEAPDVLAIVYRSDAPSRREVEVVYEVPDHLAPEILYAAAVGARSRYPERAMRLVDALSGSAFGGLLERHGFRRPTPPARGHGGAPP